MEIRDDNYKTDIKLMWLLAKNDFKVRYAGSYFGAIWAFIQPIVTILVFWFVFQVGFRSAGVKGHPYILWLISGLVPWFYITDVLSNATNVFIEYSYLVKKVVFPVWILPIVKILSSLFVHAFFVMFIIGMFMFYGYGFHWVYLQLLYYLFASIIFLASLSYISASIAPFFKDVNQIVGIVLQLSFWLTPIFWDYSRVPSKWSILTIANPFFYITNGYRSTLLYGTKFWDFPLQTCVFWITTLGLFFIGRKMFLKLEHHFPDVL